MEGGSAESPGYKGAAFLLETGEAEGLAAARNSDLGRKLRCWRRTPTPWQKHCKHAQRP